MDDLTRKCDDAVAAVAKQMDFPGWEMDKPIYKSQYGTLVEHDPGARTFRLSGSTELRAHHFWGSAVGGATPGVTAMVFIPSGRYDLQAELVKRFHQAIEEVLG